MFALIEVRMKDPSRFVNEDVDHPSRFAACVEIAGFDLKHVYTNGDWIRGLQKTGKSFWNPDGAVQITFGFLYDCQKDLLTVNSKTQINVTKKVMMH